MDALATLSLMCTRFVRSLTKFFRMSLKKQCNAFDADTNSRNFLFPFWKLYHYHPNHRLTSRAVFMQRPEDRKGQHSGVCHGAGETETNKQAEVALIQQSG